MPGGRTSEPGIAEVGRGEHHGAVEVGDGGEGAVVEPGRGDLGRRGPQRAGGARVGYDGGFVSAQEGALGGDGDTHMGHEPGDDDSLVDLLDVTGPPEVFSLLQWELAEPTGYRVVLAAETLEPVSTTRRIDDLRPHIARNISRPLTVATLAAHAHIGDRQLTRIFKAELGMTPAAYIEAARVEVARNRLETTDDTLDRVATECGFGTTDTLTRAFRRSLGITPAAYRNPVPRPHPGSVSTCPTADIRIRVRAYHLRTGATWARPGVSRAGTPAGHWRGTPSPGTPCRRDVRPAPSPPPRRCR